MFTEELFCSDRINHLKNKLFEQDRYFSVEQALLITDSYNRHKNEPRILQRARAFAHTANTIQIIIDPSELIVGNRSSGIRAGIVFPEAGNSWIESEIDTLATRTQDRFAVHAKDKDDFLKHIVPSWKGRTLEDAIKDGEEGKLIKDIEKVVKINQKDHAQGHILPDLVNWLNMGPSGLKEKVKNLQVSCTDDNKKDFYLAQSIVLEASQTFMLRYGELADKMAEEEEYKNAVKNLKNISAICKKLSSHSADTFHEALQSTWFLFVLLQLESNASSFSPGRLDQFLLPYYLKDKGSKTLDDQGALELIEALWLKFNQIVYMRNAESASFFAGFPIGFNVAIGGQTKEGKSAVNELSYLMLKAQEHIGLPQPNLSARLFRDIQFDFMLECARIIGMGSGMPQIFNDEAIIPALKNQGIDHEDAVDYGIVGCVELSTHGNNLGWSDAAMFNMVKVIELTMNDGVCLLTGNQMGLQTGSLESYESYEHFENALEKQMNYFIEGMMKCCEFVDKTHARLLPSPFLSSVINDCTDKGIDVTAGGAQYNLLGIQFIQVANVADSLATIKSAIFEKKAIDPTEFINTIRNDYEGQGELRHWILKEIPKYGNDVEWVDKLGLKWARKFAEKINSYRNARGGRCHTGFYTVSAHIPMGKNVGASADGRLAQTPLADGGMSAVYGRDVAGPTALLKSVSRIDSILGSNGTLLNMKFLPEIFESDKQIEKFVYLLKGLVKLKISHVQFNVVSKEDLIIAQKNPGDHKNLTIRVAGYTAFFVDLAEDLQNEIIARTEYGSSESQ